MPVRIIETGSTEIFAEPVRRILFRLGVLQIPKWFRFIAMVQLLRRLFKATPFGSLNSGEIDTVTTKLFRVHLAKAENESRAECFERGTYSSATDQLEFYCDQASNSTAILRKSRCRSLWNDKRQSRQRVRVKRCNGTSFNRLALE